MLKKIFIVLLAAALIGNVSAQTSETKNSVGGSFIWNNFQGPLGAIKDIKLQDNDFQGFSFNYARFLNKSFNARVPLGFGTMNYPTFIDKNKVITETQSTTVGSLGLHLIYKFNNGYILQEEAFVAPYLYAGINGLYGVPDAKVKNSNLDFTVPVGAGIKFRFDEVLNIFIEADYNKSLVVGKDFISPKIGVAFLLDKLKDTDKDGISDKEDACPTVRGLLAFKGCPDTDGDGITDADDGCPTERGTKEMNGCPDTDGDGITDKDDKCPDEKGTKEMNGCPDKDGDGVADKDDKCPDVAGLAAMNGCPDGDGDGITDADDACPAVAGLAAFKGCPDTDGDGIADKDDKCPTEKGIAENFGCPKVEPVKVVEAVKIIEKDTDGDGILDKNDKCPTEVGVAENFGCPIKKEVTFTFDNILFETGKSTLKAESFATLDQVVTILKNNPNHRANIAGHTDSQGSAPKNLTLSAARAKTCLDYLASKGIAATRLTSSGEGDTVPVADNKTPEGRARNRRVEFKLYLPK